MFGNRRVSAEDFDCLLDWLDGDREMAGFKYERIRRNLIQVFTCRGCHCPDELADETFDRVAPKVKGIRDTWSGDPALFFYGVGRNVCREYFRRLPHPAPISPPAQSPAPEEDLECLDECLQELTPRNRELFIEYYTGEKRAGVNHRMDLARLLGIEIGALRLRIHRIRTHLQGCVTLCLARRHGLR
ncbi:MAG: sigma-70 family RNA polymerase sigma factor [Acidobacteriota bacterium]